jgi:ribosome biogenesis GTPase
MTLRDIGFDSWFEAHATGLCLDGRDIARVSAVDRGAYRITDAARDVPARLSGRLAYQTPGPDALPCVGDWVAASLHDNAATAVIHRVFPRRTFLRRKTPGETVALQMIAANIDTAFLVQSCHFDLNPGRLERYLAMAADGHVEPVVVLTKTDLVTREELEAALAAVRAVTTAPVVAVSNATGDGFEDFRRRLAPGRTHCLLGSSGVGKTTLVNRLMGHASDREAFAVRAVSGTGEGVHTTTRRQLVMLGQGAMLIDTPGMRELGLVGANGGIDAGFPEIAALAAHCRYADCSHNSEPGCAVRAAIAAGELPEERYASYSKLMKESRHHAMSYLEKRKKDKAFGRFVKSVKKGMRR